MFQQMYSICRSTITSHGHHYLLNSPSFFFSTIPDLQPHFMVNYLITNLKLSNPEATLVSTNLRHLTTPQNPQSVITFLKSYNLTSSQIKSLIISNPSILLRNVDKTLAPKFKVLSELGFSKQDLVTVINRDHNMLLRSLHTSIVPTINLLMNILGSKEKIVKAFLKSHFPFYGRYFRANLGLLKKYGVSVDDTRKLILRNPRLVTQNPVRLEEKLIEVEKVFGITPGSSMFSYGLSALCSMNSLNLRRKFEVFRSFGWLDSDIFMIVNRQPLCLTHSEERLRKGLSFFVEELGLTPAWLSTRGSLLMYSLEKRVKPRYRVYVVLKEKGVMTRELHSVMCFSDEDFVKNVVEKFKEELPDQLYDSYTKKEDEQSR